MNPPPGVIPPPQVPNNPNPNPFPQVIPPPQVPNSINTTPQPNLVPVQPILTDTPVIIPPGTGQGNPLFIPNPNSIPGQPPLPPLPIVPGIVPPAATTQAPAVNPGIVPPGTGIIPPVASPATTAAPLVVTTGLPAGVNTLSTTAQPVPGIAPPGVGTPGLPFFETTSAPATPVNPPPGVGTPGLPFFETTSGPPPATIPNPNSIPGLSLPPLPLVTPPETPVTPGVIPPPITPPGIIIPGLPGTGVTPQPTPYPTARPTTTARPTPFPTPYPTMPTPFPTTPRPTPFPTPYPTTPAPSPPLPGHIYGAYMQNCPEPLGTEQCQQIDEWVTDQTGNAPVVGQVTCNAKADCCLCQGIQCGEVGGNSCTALVLSGEKAAYGVQDINVVVDTVAGTPATATCSGLESCKKAILRGNMIAAMRCTGRFGCQQSEIVINNPAPGFTLECGVTSACENSKITLNILPPAGTTCDPLVVNDLLLGAISCIGVNACRGMELTINNMGCDNVIIESIECRLDTCADARFNFYGTSAIGVQACELPATGAQPLGIERCYSQLASLACPDPGSCMNQQRTLIDPINGFLLSCESEMSCLNADYTIQVTPAEYAVPTEQITIQCNSVQSCQGASFHFTNDNVTPLYVEAFCNAERSCNGATFTTTSNVFLMEIECGSPELCMGCTLNGLPCGGHGFAGGINVYQPPGFPAVNMPPMQAPPNPAYPGGLYPVNPNPTFPQQPNVPSVPSPPQVVDPWSQPNPWAMPTGPSFSGNPNQFNPQPYPTFNNPNTQPISPSNPNNPPNPVSIPTIPQNPNPNPNPSIPTFPIQPVAPAPPQNQIPPPIMPSNPNQNFQPAPANSNPNPNPWAQPNPWLAQPQPVPYYNPMDPYYQQQGPSIPPPVMPSNPNPWAQPAPPNPWLPATPPAPPAPPAPQTPPPNFPQVNVPQTQGGGQQPGPSFAFSSVPVFPQQQPAAPGPI
eukprot:CAMPEP_0201591826 /NCGR_PEP_ID=MMETSP0190_2-20130828/189882_1 /ASSEMBLY_ACC=CAM_ASM_000263 /TAXON_ID=37353 /ORGANISM="Rosalina sp." /LENGTH=964 /DNA_ID=CAMNT_0048050311 /DNA_START=306 /DNA_END=3200 /DNA_ORIENTATION=+